MRRAITCLVALVSVHAAAGPLAAPGDLRLRHDLQSLNDAGITDIPLTAWPVSLDDIDAALDAADPANVFGTHQPAYERVRKFSDERLRSDRLTISFGATAAVNPRIIRSFEHTPREDGELIVNARWAGERLTVNLAASYVSNPFDGDEVRTDGTYIGFELGNWMLTAGWQDRWYGPGRDGSLVLSNNARPPPGVGIQRRLSLPFRSRWLRWTGPWTFATFMALLDDERTIDDAWLFGARGSFRPLPGLEIGISRTAQWCGYLRPCGLSTFGDLLIGNDNRDVNVPVDDEPGNQLGGFDIRWSLPGGIPIAAYMEWIGEDGRGGGGAIGSWMRHVGFEIWGSFGDASHRTHVEIADSMCREGGFGFSDRKPDCAYEHSIYSAGYRYENRVLAHPADGDSLSYSVGSTLVQSAGHTWNTTLRYMEINRAGAASQRHTLSPTPRELVDVQVSHWRETRLGHVSAGIGFSRLDDTATGQRESDIAAFVSWRSQ